MAEHSPSGDGEVFPSSGRTGNGTFEDATLVRLMLVHPHDVSGHRFARVFDRTKRDLAERYGGVTVYDDCGGIWLGPDGMEADEVYVLESACIQEPFEAEHLTAIQFDIAESLDEDSVFAYTTSIGAQMYTH